MLYTALLLLLSNGFFMLRLGSGSAGSFPKPLSAAEERECVEKWLNEGDVEARNRLIEHNLRLVAHITKKYYNQTGDQDDLISIGTIGLIKGVSTYRPDKNVRLATYASRCIENEVLMYFRSMKKTAGDVSLSDSIDMDGEGNSLMLMDVLASEEDMHDELSLKETASALRKCIDRVLDERERRVIKMRYGFEGEEKCLTQRETAEMLGISRSYVSRIEKKALEKLKAALEG